MFAFSPPLEGASSEVTLGSAPFSSRPTGGTGRRSPEGRLGCPCMSLPSAGGRRRQEAQQRATARHIMGHATRNATHKNSCRHMHRLAGNLTSMRRNGNSGGKGRSGSGGRGGRWTSRKKQRRKRPWHAMAFRIPKCELLMIDMPNAEGRHNAALHVRNELELAGSACSVSTSAPLWCPLG